MKLDSPLPRPHHAVRRIKEDEKMKPFMVPGERYGFEERPLVFEGKKYVFVRCIRQLRDKGAFEYVVEGVAVDSSDFVQFIVRYDLVPAPSTTRFIRGKEELHVVR